MAGVCTGPGPCDTHPTGHGGDNFVTRGGGFDPYLRAIINALKRSGHSESEAVQLAIGTVQRWARGEGNVTAATRARAAASLAHWEALKAASHALTADAARTVDLADSGHVYRWRHGWIPITPHAALQKAHGSHAGAARILHGNGQHEDAHAMLRAGLAHHEALGHAKTAARYRQTLAATSGGGKARIQIRAGSYRGSAGHHIVGQDTQGRRVSVFTPGERSQAEKAAENIRAGRSAFDAPSQPKAPEVPSARTQGIEIAHSGDGTLVHGTSRTDGSAAVLKQHGFRWSSNLGAWYLPRNQHFATRSAKVDNAERDLKAAGHDVAVTREAARTTTAAEREIQQRERSATRAEHLDQRASKLTAEADRRHDAARQIMDRIPMGQPILIGHHSERGHRADLKRIDSHIGKSLEARAEATDATRRADAARRTATQNDGPLMRQRRIDRNEAEIRKIDKSLAQHDIAVKKPEAAARFGIHPSSPAHLEQLRAARAELADQVAHDRAQIAASGHKAITAADIKPGDTIHYRGRTHVVKKVNKTTVSVPTGYSWDDKVPINQITHVVKPGASLTAAPAATVDLAEPVMATTDGPNLMMPAGQHYRHGWVRIDAAMPTAVERATRAAITDGHALLHGQGMVAAAQSVAERVKAAGHGVRVQRVHVAGKTHLHIRRTTR